MLNQNLFNSFQIYPIMRTVSSMVNPMKYSVGDVVRIVRYPLLGCFLVEDFFNDFGMICARSINGESCLVNESDLILVEGSA